MTATGNIHEAKTHLSKLIARVRIGEEIVIAKAGEPVARLVPEGRRRKLRRRAPARGQSSFTSPSTRTCRRIFSISLRGEPARRAVS